MLGVDPQCVRKTVERFTDRFHCPAATSILRTARLRTARLADEGRHQNGPFQASLRMDKNEGIERRAETFRYKLHHVPILVFERQSARSGHSLSPSGMNCASGLNRSMYSAALDRRNALGRVATTSTRRSSERIPNTGQISAGLRTITAQARSLRRTYSRIAHRQDARTFCPRRGEL